MRARLPRSERDQLELFRALPGDLERQASADEAKWREEIADLLMY